MEGRRVVGEVLNAVVAGRVWGERKSVVLAVAGRVGIRLVVRVVRRCVAALVLVICMVLARGRVVAVACRVTARRVVGGR